MLASNDKLVDINNPYKVSACEAEVLAQESPLPCKTESNRPTKRIRSSNCADIAPDQGLQKARARAAANKYPLNTNTPTLNDNHTNTVQR